MRLRSAVSSATTWLRSMRNSVQEHATYRGRTVVAMCGVVPVGEAPSPIMHCWSKNAREALLENSFICFGSGYGTNHCLLRCFDATATSPTNAASDRKSTRLNSSHLG